jgi:hypothetical protein
MPDSEKVQIFVRLLNEGTEVSRPTTAVLLDDGSYQLLPPENYDPNDEHWEFLPGQKVLAEKHNGTSGDYLLAVSPLKSLS